jgi:hypothetical protein
MKPKPPVSSDYVAFLAEMKSRILTARITAGRAVNCELIMLYWDIGRGIVEKQKQLGWGKSVVERLAKDLQTAFPGGTGFSARNLRNMKQFFLAYSGPEFWQQPVAKISCGIPAPTKTAGGV